MSVTLGHANRLVAAALAAAGDAGAKVAVVVLDAGGHILSLQRHEDAYVSAGALAQAKAFTALNFRTPTHEMARRLKTVEYAVQISTADPRLTFLKGGYPLRVDDRVVGAIGVSGGSADEDMRSCESALLAADLT